MAVEYSYLIILTIYITMLCLILYPRYLVIGFKPIFYLMLLTHFIYGLGVLFLYLLAIGSYNQLRTTEVGKRLENSIIRGDNANLEHTNGIQYRYLGESVLFYCKTHVANPEAGDIVWTHDGLEINPSFDRINITDENIGLVSSLLIKNILQVDYGVYSCSFQPRWTRYNLKKEVNKTYYLPYQSIKTFYLKRFQPKIERLFIPPGGILQLDIRYHTVTTDAKSTIRYTINQKPINIKDDRTLYTKCSFFVYQYWLLFQYGYFLKQLEVSSNGSHLHGIKTIQTKTNFCVNDEFYGTYKFYIQSIYTVEKSTGRTKLIDFEYPVTYEVVPRRPDLFDSDYFTIPSKVTVTNEISQCWLNESINYKDYCEDMLEIFKSVPALFFTLEFIIFTPMLFIAYVCFQHYVYILNKLVIWFYFYMQLETPFQIIKQHRKSKSLAQTQINHVIKEKKLLQIYVSYAESDLKEVGKLTHTLENILQEISEMNDATPTTSVDETLENTDSDNLENLQDENNDRATVMKHVYTRNDGSPCRPLITCVAEYINRCNVFIIYASDNYIETMESMETIHAKEFSFIIDHSSGNSEECLFLLKYCSKDLSKLVSNPFVFWCPGGDISNVAKRNTLKTWTQTVLQRNAFKVQNS